MVPTAWARPLRVVRHDDPPWVRVEGFTRRDGVRHNMSGYAWITQDSFLVYAIKPHSTHGVWTPKPGSARLAGLGRPDVDFRPILLASIDLCHPDTPLVSPGMEN